MAVELFATSFVVLFQELTLIRWLPGQVRVLAYFPNLILLSAFLGLGLGCLRAGRRSLLWMWPLSLLVLVATAAAMSGVAFTQESASEHLWLLYYDLPRDAPVVGDVRPPIVLGFILSALTFVPLGQLVAERLREFRARSISLWGYSWDILGSLLGVIGFAALGFAETFPITWFEAFLLVGLLFFISAPRSLVAYTGLAIAVLATVTGAERADRYSPYYAIRTDRSRNQSDFGVLTNGSLHQHALSLRSGPEAPDEWHANVRRGYHVPYQLLGQAPRRVLVLGAGTGNDVSVALDEGAKQVDAVEIDPLILELGESHPDHPYASPRVRKFNSDARSFLNESHEQYDLIVFGTLDSMTRLSALSNVRLDNFVYTADCLRAARARLSPDGGIVMYFMVGAHYIDQRLAAMLASLFEAPPLVVTDHFELFNRMYMAGPAFAHQFPEERMATAPRLARLLATIELPSDDWPYLYLERRGIGRFYLVLMAIFAALAVASVVLVSGEMRRSLMRGRKIDVEMFCFGLAFLLLETKSVTTMNLVWGATWLTSAVVFGAILAMVLVATVLMQLRPLSWPVCVTGLIGSLLIAYVIPLHSLLRLSMVTKLALSTAFVGAPIFFAAACFALVFRDREQADVAFGWNLLGAVAGGLLEFFSMATGIGALYLIALVSYLLVVLVRQRAHSPVPEHAPAARAAGLPSEGAAS